MSLKEGLKRYPMAIVWSLIISTALVMEAYDSSLLVGGEFYTMVVSHGAYQLT